MVSVRKEFVLVIDIPRKIYEYQKRGYNHFEADFAGDSRRVQIRAWKRKDRSRHKIECETCQGRFSNRNALKTHQLHARHGLFVLKVDRKL